MARRALATARSETGEPTSRSAASEPRVTACIGPALRDAIVAESMRNNLGSGSPSWTRYVGSGRSCASHSNWHVFARRRKREVESHALAGLHPAPRPPASRPIGRKRGGNDSNPNSRERLRTRPEVFGRKRGMVHSIRCDEITKTHLSRIGQTKPIPYLQRTLTQISLCVMADVMM